MHHPELVELDTTLDRWFREALLALNLYAHEVPAVADHRESDADYLTRLYGVAMRQAARHEGGPVADYRKCLRWKLVLVMRARNAARMWRWSRARYSAAARRTVDQTADAAYWRRDGRPSTRTPEKVNGARNGLAARGLALASVQARLEAHRAPDPQDVLIVRELVEAGQATKTQVAEALGCSRKTVHRWLAG